MKGLLAQHLASQQCDCPTAPVTSFSMPCNSAQCAGATGTLVVGYDGMPSVDRPKLVKLHRSAALVHHEATSFFGKGKLGAMGKKKRRRFTNPLEYDFSPTSVFVSYQ